MKRLALVVAAAAAVLGGTGCGSTCASGTTLVAWSGFDGPGAARNQACAAAGVATVDVFVDDSLVGNWPCTDYGAAVPGVPTGGNILTVEGLAGGSGSTVLFRDDFPYTQVGCGSTSLRAAPGAGTVEVDYSFAPTNACASPAPTYMWLEVRDDIAGRVAFADTGLGAAQVCSVTAPAPQYDLPNGSYTLVGIQEMTPGGAAVLGADCTDRPFGVSSGQITTVSPVLVNSTLACF